MKKILALIMAAALAGFAGKVMAAIPEPVSLTPFIQLNEAQTAAIVYGTQGGSWDNSFFDVKLGKTGSGLFIVVQ